MHYLETIKDKTDIELLEIYYNVDAWNPEMIEGVKKELNKRNILPAKVIEEKIIMDPEYNFNLETGQSASLFGLIIGWLFVFGLLGIAIGYRYTYAKETSKYTDEVYYMYDESSRQKGRYLFFTSIIFSCVSLIFKLFGNSF